MRRSFVLVSLALAVLCGPSIASSFDSVPNMADIVEKVSPCVVNIVGESAPRKQLTPFELFFGLHGRHNIVPRRGEGSGFVIDARGLILTNQHVIENADRLTINMANGRKYKARVKAADPTHDIAVLELEQPIEPALTVEQVATLGDSDKARPGEWVLAIGSPFSLQKTVTKGIVSGLNRHLSIQGRSYLNLIQTDALINPGNSGGPLIDMKGQVIGIAAAINPNAQGIGFAIPINTARRIASDLIAHGKYRPTWLGVRIASLSEAQAKDFGVGNIAGVMVQRVVPESPAAKAGLVAGDLITQVNGQRVESPVELKLKVEAVPAGKKAVLGVLRGGKEQRLDVTIDFAPDDGAVRDEDGESGEAPAPPASAGLGGLGIAARDLTAQDRQRLSLPADAKGVLVTDVEDGSRAQALGLAADDVVLWANRKDVDSAKALAEALKESQGGVLLKVWRRGALLFMQAAL
jgi:serine protease Do